ncbi:MAG: SpoIIE family protein phosphatase [Desulfobacterales bacterium]|jgi:sigma-B regulation protein RsbU (phosphoserine phosphatase)
MIRPKSLQQRLSLFMILPVALLLVGMGIASFIYARTDVNRLVTADTRESGHFMTLFYAEIDPSSKTLQWVRAGHDPAFFYDPTSDTIEELPGEGIALGIDANYA